MKKQASAPSIPPIREYKPPRKPPNKVPAAMAKGIFGIWLMIMAKAKIMI
jgi:hypothetical protein